MRTRLILDEDVNAPGSVNVEGLLISAEGKDGMHATHTGDLFGIGATGKKARLASIIIYRFAGGKIVEEWEIFDVLGLYQQLGLAPPPA